MNDTKAQQRLILIIELRESKALEAFGSLLLSSNMVAIIIK